MILKTLNGQNFKTVIDQLNFHDCSIIGINQSENVTNIDFEYYNWEEADQNSNSSWYTLRLSIIKLIKLDFYNPDPGTFTYDINTWEYDIHLNEIEKMVKANLSIKDDMTNANNFLSVIFYTHSSKDLEFGFNGYVKILGLDCSINILKEHERIK